MNALTDIVNLINQACIVDQFSSRRLQSGSWNNIADIVKTIDQDSESTQPLIIDNTGEGTSMVFDDRYPFVVFHRIRDISYENCDDAYGKPGNTTLETAEMRLVFSGSRKRMQARPEDVARAINIDFPKEINYANISVFGITSLRIEMGALELDPYTVWNQEFSGTDDVALSTDTILITLDYKLISTYDSGCWQLCS